MVAVIQVTESYNYDRVQQYPANGDYSENLYPRRI